MHHAIWVKKVEKDRKVFLISILSHLIYMPSLKDASVSLTDSVLSVSQYNWIPGAHKGMLGNCVSDGAPFSWWIGGPGPGKVQTYWGGAVPGSQRCACGLKDNCLDSNHYCNCDADDDRWYSSMCAADLRIAQSALAHHTVVTYQ